MALMAAVHLSSMCLMKDFPVGSIGYTGAVKITDFGGIFVVSCSCLKLLEMNANRNQDFEKDSYEIQLLGFSTHTVCDYGKWLAHIIC